MIEALMSQLGATPSYWQESGGDAPYPPLEKLPATAPLVIVGGGLAGVGFAHEMVERGCAPGDIVLLEGSRLVAGASGRNGGFMMTFPGPELMDWQAKYGSEFAARILHANELNRTLVRATVEENALPCDRGGSHYLAATAEEDDVVARCAEFIRANSTAGDVEFVAAEAHHPYPYHDLRRSGDFGVHPVMYTHAMLKKSRVSYATNCTVTGVAEESTGVELVTSRGKIRAGRVVLATNVYLPLLAPQVAIVPRRNQVMLIRPENAAGRVWGAGIYYANHGYEYWRQFPDGRILLGGLRNRDLDGENALEVGANERVLRVMREEFLPKLTQGHPFAIEYSWSGVMGFTKDELPVFGWLDGKSRRVAFLGGFSGFGLGLHRALVKDVATMLDGGGEDSVFSFKRLH